MPVFRLVAAVCALALAVLAFPPKTPAAAPAGGMVIYRCVDPASGAVTLQNDVPCPKGQQQTVRNVAPLPAFRAPPASPPAPRPDPKPTAPPPPVAAEPPPSAVRTPPPPLFQCRTWDDKDYLGDTAEPPASCVALETVGIDGSAALAAGQACEMRRDACTPVPAELLCVAWKKRVDEAEFRWKIAGSRDDAQKAEFERVVRVYRASTCGG